VGERTPCRRCKFYEAIRQAMEEEQAEDAL
jgi:hypothetical protein